MKQIIASGGGGFSMENTPIFDLYVLAAAGKIKPKICLLPTASGDDPNYINHFQYFFSEMPCKTSYLKLINPSVEDMEDFLLSKDIIYVGGGNTKSMLGIWREWGIDKILKKAYDNGVVLAGMSAGGVCWYEEFISDSFPGKWGCVKGLGILPGSAAVHYNEASGRALAYSSYVANKTLPSGIGINNNTAIHYIDEKIHRIVGSRKGCSVTKVSMEDEIKLEILNSEDIEITIDTVKSFINN